MWNYVSSSKIIELKQQAYSYDRHIKIVNKAKATIDNGTPYKHKFTSRLTNKYQQYIQLFLCNKTMQKQIEVIQLYQEECCTQILTVAILINRSLLNLIKIYPMFQKAASNYILIEIECKMKMKKQQLDLQQRNLIMKEIINQHKHKNLQHVEKIYHKMQDDWYI
ncbi:unnamed protein product [Paramecium sonneborni]|uniref:Uncharacterized protein n=1 Tax=Paramecium sonneborni TaxID=65129 RepID=A0A8S1QUN9_9CILI|nr:unnamed protein product [Paramecium sonneborni]